MATVKPNSQNLRLELGKCENDNPPKDISVIRFGRKAMTRYGKYVIEDRALPDFRDGLKPVHRKILWAMYDMGLTSGAQRKKSARLIGDVIGKWHPHGDNAAHQALVTITGCKNGDNISVPLADGEGNWFGGIMGESAAAPRYTNTRMSRFSQANFFNPDYVAVIDKVPNYDETEKEPVVLPSLLPNLLVNGTFGIGVAVTSVIPAYTVDSLKTVVVELLKGKTHDPEFYANTLKFNYPLGGGECTSDIKSLTNLYSNPHGHADFKSLYKWNETSRKMTFYSFAPGLNVPNLQAFLLGRKDGRGKPPVWIKHIADALDETNRTDGSVFSVVFKKTSSKSEIENVKQRVAELFTSRMNYKINVTERVLKDGVEDVVFHSLSIPRLLEKWVTWRVDLELRMLQYKIGVNAKNQAHTNLLILACSNIKTIVKALEQDAPEQYLMRELKISEQEANTILDLKVRNLSKLDGTKLKEKLNNLVAESEELKGHQKNPNGKIIADMKAWKAV